MEYVAEIVKAAGSAIGGLAGAWAVTMCICNAVKMLCVTYLVNEADMTAADAKECYKIEPVWKMQNTKDAVNKTKSKW